VQPTKFYNEKLLKRPLQAKFSLDGMQRIHLVKRNQKIKHLY
jgi:hypothetical protein